MPTLAAVELESFRNYQFTVSTEPDFGEEHFLVAGERRELLQALEGLQAMARGSAWKISSAPTGLWRELRDSAGILIPSAVREMDFWLTSPILRLRTEATEVPWEFVCERIVARQALGEPPKVQPCQGRVALWAGTTHPGVFSWMEPSRREALAGWKGEVVEDRGKGLLEGAKAGAAFLVAGLSESGELVVEDSTLNLAGWVPRQLHKPRKVCRCLFLYLVDHFQGSGLYQRADSVAQAMLALGVESVVVNYWQPTLSRLPKAVGRFFSSLENSSVGQAFQTMRESFSEEDERLSRWAFGLYGNPDLAACDLVPLEVGSRLSATTIPRFGKADYRIKITAGPEKGREVPIFSHSLGADQKLVVGRPGLKRCQIEVDDKALGQEAFVLEWEEERVYLANLGKAPESVTLEGLPLYGRLRLQSGQRIRSGDSEFLFSAAEGASSPALPTARTHGDQVDPTHARYFLRVTGGVDDDRDRWHALKDPSTVVGREGAFLLHDPAVSRRHFTILERDGVFFAEPSSGASLFLNGVPVEKVIQLRHGDRLVLSQSTSLEFLDGTRQQRKEPS